GEGLARAGDQRVGDARVPAAGEDGEAGAGGGAQVAFVMRHGDGSCGWLAILTVGAALAPRPGKGSPPWRLPQVAAQAPLLQGKVFHHFEAVAGEADLAPRGAEHAQLAEAEVGQDLRAG